MSHKTIRSVLILLGVCAGWLGLAYQHSFYAPAVNGKPVTVEIDRGDSLFRITEKLVAKDLNINPFWFIVIAICENSATKLKAGEYELTAAMTIPDIIKLLAQGKTKQYAITFPEGWSFKDILQAVNNNPKLGHTIDQADFQSIMKKWGADTLIPEGLFFPDTYFFEKNQSDISLLKRAYDKMQAVLQEEWRNKAEGLPFKTPYEALILASIIEKESGMQSERPMIAGVFIRRLKNDMLLQTDPTVIYGMGENYKGNIGTIDLQTATPYNTYVFKGLPPTPIAMPSREAIKSVLHPDHSDNLYFVSRGDGTHVFTSTLTHHNQAVKQYQKQK
ncbi:MAG: endolytic transglycosylase MltG [Gammaproteobacteria bacterium]